MRIRSVEPPVVYKQYSLPLSVGSDDMAFVRKYQPLWMDVENHVPELNGTVTELCWQASCWKEGARESWKKFVARALIPPGKRLDGRTLQAW